MASATDFAKMVPGFDFLQGLMKNAGAGLPPMGQWIAPTLDPKELDKRIGELRTVQFWLEQNAKLLATTIQALEVQRMTLSTLQTMNLPLADLRGALTLPTAPAAPATAAPAAARKAMRRQPKAAEASAPQGAPLVDPMQWWGALTQQFTELAAKALKDGTTEAARNLAGAAAQQSVERAGQAIRTMAGVATAPVKGAARVAGAAAGAAAAAAGVARRPRRRA
jgi:hypothetical protein